MGNPEGSRLKNDPLETMKQIKQKAVTLPLSQKALELILGSLLGDGSLKIHPKYKNARFSFRHSVKQKEYFFWKMSFLKDISSEKCFWQQLPDGKAKVDKLRYQSLALPSLTELYKLCHKRKRFTIKRKWLNKMTALSLAVWWFDDGSITGNGRQGVFCTDAFSYKDQMILKHYLKSVWGIKTAIGRMKKNQESYRLWIRATGDLEKLLKIILPFVPSKEMLPKILLLYKDNLFQQRWISEVARLSGFSLDIIEKTLKSKKERWKNFRE